MIILQRHKTLLPYMYLYTQPCGRLVIRYFCLSLFFFLVKRSQHLLLSSCFVISLFSQLNTKQLLLLLLIQKSPTCCTLFRLTTAQTLTKSRGNVKMFAIIILRTQNFFSVKLLSSYLVAATKCCASETSENRRELMKLNTQ